MRDTTRPDFEKLAKQHVVDLYGSCNPSDSPDRLRIDSFMNACEKIYSDYVEKGGEEEEKVIKVEAGQMFSVDGKLYSITNPAKATDVTNEHGQCVWIFYKTVS